MQKDLRMMNVRLEIALNDITSESGKAIIEAIIAGERNPEILANLVNYRVKKSKAEIALSLEGNWESQYIFLLKQHYKEYQQNIEFIKEIDSEIDCLLIESFSNDGEDIGEIPIHKKSLKKNKNKIASDICSHSFLYFGGVDLFAIEGINNNTVLTLMAEVGQDIDKIHSAKAFANWLHLCPNPKISGNRVISSRTKKGSNPLKIALRNAANIIGNSKIDNHLTKFFKKIAFKKGRMQAITATAHKLATIIYNMLTKKQPYKPFVYAENTEQKKKTTINKIKQLMQKYNINPEEAFVIT